MADADERLRVGLDTGISGAAVLINAAFRVVEYFTFSKDANGFLNALEFLRKLEEWSSVYGPLDIWYEDSYGRPGKPAVTEFNFGKYYGAQIAACRVAQRICEDPIELHPVHATTWQSFYGLISKSKKASVTAARLTVGMDTKNHNLADAALIAAYGLSQAGK